MTHDDETVERVLLREVLTWLRDPRLNQWNYMEGTAFYVDKHAMAEKIEAALSALPRAEADDGWRTIESAPKDGTLCLFFAPGRSKAKYIERAKRQMTIVDAFSPQWVNGKYQLPENPYTHWRPLPAPPAQAGER